MVLGVSCRCEMYYRVCRLCGDQATNICSGLRRARTTSGLFVHPLPHNSSMPSSNDPSRPSSDDFALVPRAYSDRFFSTISTFYACDSSSWPPTGSWWNPRCDGKSLGESVLFRHLHASEVDYRVYPMFDYVPTLHEQEGSKCAKKKSAYASACVLLDTWGLVPPSFSG